MIQQSNYFHRQLFITFTAVALFLVVIFKLHEVSPVSTNSVKGKRP